MELESRLFPRGRNAFSKVLDTFTRWTIWDWETLSGFQMEKYTQSVSKNGFCWKVRKQDTHMLLVWYISGKTVGALCYTSFSGDLLGANLVSSSDLLLSEVNLKRFCGFKICMLMWQRMCCVWTEKRWKGNKKGGREKTRKVGHH